MKKIGLLCLALVLALGTLGAGFAWWTETLDIGQNPVNTGELKVIFTSMYGEVPLPKYAGACVAEVYTAAGKWYPSEGGNPQYLPLTDDTFTFKFRNMFPGAYYQVYWLRAKNAGTIPAKIQSVALANVSDPGTIGGYVEWKSCYGTWASIKRPDGSVRVSISTPALNVWTPIADVPGKIYSGLQPHVLFPGETLEFDAENPEEECFSIRLSPLAPNSAEGYTFDYDMVFTWTQFNAP